MQIPEMDILKENLLFKTMPPKDIEEIVNTMEPHIRYFEKDQVIARDGEYLDCMAVILSGKVYLSHIDSSGNSNLMEVLMPEKTKILFLNVDSLLRENILTAPLQIRFLQNLTIAFAQKSHRLAVKLEDSIRRSTRDKLQDYLSSQYHKAESRTFSIPLNRQELADFLFVDRSAMSNELCKMRDEGLLKFDKSKFELLIKMPIGDEEDDPND